MNRKERRLQGEPVGKSTKKNFRNKAAKKHAGEPRVSPEVDEQEEILALEQRIQAESPAPGTQTKRLV
jgi:hypothetical protein